MLESLIKIKLPPPEIVDAEPSLGTDKVIIMVDESRFVTTRETLKESVYFSTMLSDGWKLSNPPRYFLDADPELFKHVLRYLRHGTYPLFFDRSKGHDYAMYTAILQLAQLLEIPDLVAWLSGAYYLRAVDIRWSSQLIDGQPHLLPNTSVADVEIEHRPVWRTRQIYLCPRAIACHEGKPELCGKDCRKAQAGYDIEYRNEDFLTTLLIRKEIVYDHSICSSRTFRPMKASKGEAK